VKGEFIKMSSPNPGLAPTFGRCSECNLFHPPVSGPCPMAPPKDADGIAVVSIEKFLNNIRVQLKVKIERTKIQNMDNFFIYMSTELNKLVDGYKE
jgi:hypothetical protein